MSMAIQIKLENFEGPLDLLIHLVEKNKMDITKIDIFQIIEDYLMYIKEAQELNPYQDLIGQSIQARNRLEQALAKPLMPD